jgi:hypothetical protein
VQQLPSESIPQSSTPLDETVTGTSPAAGGDDAPANAPLPISAASVKPESDLSSVPAAEVLQAERDSVTLAPLAADAPYIYDSLDDQTFHRTLSDFVQQAQGQYAEFGLTPPPTTDASSRPLASRFHRMRQGGCGGGDDLPEDVFDTEVFMPGKSGKSGSGHLDQHHAGRRTLRSVAVALLHGQMSDGAQPFIPMSHGPLSSSPGPRAKLSWAL